MGDEQARATVPEEQPALVVSAVEDSGRPFTDPEVPVLELDENVPPRPEEEIADILRAERQV